MSKEESYNLAYKLQNLGWFGLALLSLGYKPDGLDWYEDPYAMVQAIVEYGDRQLNFGG